MKLFRQETNEGDRVQKIWSTDVIQVAEIEKPKPEDNEVLIKAHLAEVTKADCEMRTLILPSNGSGYL